MNNIFNDINEKRRILQGLIDAGGVCSKVVDSCDQCPLSTAGKRSDGSWMSCLAAVAARYGDASYDDGDFAKLALNLLEDLEVENMLTRSTDD